jgi:hypothetical protein
MSPEDFEKHIVNTYRIAIRNIFDTLVSWGYLELIVNRESTLDDFIYCTYQVKSKGIDVGLKLQEHKDNEQRFNEQFSISDTLRKNSNRSVIISCVAVTFSFFALLLTYKIFVVNDARLNIAIENKISDKELHVNLKSVIKDVDNLK